MILTVAALGTELLFAPRPQLRAGVGAGGRGRVGAWLSEHRPAGAVIIGFSGATHASLGAGSLVLVEGIVSDGRDPIPLDRALIVRAQRALPGATVGAVATVAQPADPAEKARLGLDALAVDMESAHLAEEFAGRGIPFLVVRVILDELWEDVSQFPVRWTGRAVAAARKLGQAASALVPILEGR
ncbi:MAG: hypothetical protein AB7U87_03980 [Candidatus Bipolaricaulis sp.]|jgi:hypothetical protein|uniref:Nucleoside phosphorylase domain-containing protein n=1 Tax=Candidatus Bipolaricaulis anaerobius TaxID=2026885 RepID=A0A2X3K7G0_9BACT|nr:hypothetical protein [Candidatus Bipolaricaulis anaerobius]SQD93167.1 conserved protein of unknown function [Candidatus Bipolaricaulis anaerobius]